MSSIANVDLCEKFKKEAYKTHVTIPKILSKIAKLLSIKIIHISTDHLFDGKSVTSYSETSIIKPLNYYAKTKKYGEKEITKYKKNLVIRTNFFGKNEINKNSFSDKIIFNLKKKNNTFMARCIFFTNAY